MTDDHVSHQPVGRRDEHDGRRGFTVRLKRRLTSPPWLARAAGVGLSGVSLGFVVLFAFVLGSGGELTLITRPLPMQVALALPSLVAAFTLGTTVGTLLAWRYRYWSLAARIHQTILALLGLAFTWQLWTLGFLTV
jgi:hypothetical protein